MLLSPAAAQGTGDGRPGPSRFLLGARLQAHLHLPAAVLWRLARQARYTRAHLWLWPAEEVSVCDYLH